MAAATGDWAIASSYDKTHPNWMSTPLTMDGDTALHIAVRMEETKFVKKLVKRANKKDMEIRRSDGNTVFCLAAISGNEKIARILCEKNPELVWIKGHEEQLPIQLASSAGQLHMVKFLFQRIEQDNNINLPFQDIIKLFFLTLTNNIYGK
jgi:ankyrin repeat protein